MNARSRRWATAAVIGAMVVAAGTVLRGRQVILDDLARPFAVREADWAGSATCLSCHPDQHASWHRTFHRTMTQEAGRRSVVGVFDGRALTHQDIVARPVERQGRYFLDVVEGQSGRAASFEIQRTVGSRRYQQYLTRLPGDANYYRLPWLWHIGDERWVHLNGAFLGPDGEDPWAHYATWSSNCIFCHNTGPEPGLTNYEEMKARQERGEAVSFDRDARFDSRVAELGIACESCHGPGGEHARRNRSPLRRYALHLSGRRDPTIVHPETLSPRQQADLCGQCHGQRTGHTIAELVGWLEDGPTYRAGDLLAEHARPIWRDTPVPSGVDRDLFRLRFWEDGTPRLTAYEYQGLLQSPCFRRGELTCISCHTMHEGDVRGQLPPLMRTHAACTGCHVEIGTDVPAHTFHPAESSGSDCYSCHMPEAVYGIMEIHRSHRIEVPDASRDAAAARPHACTSCHLDRSLAWAARVSDGWWGGEGGRAPLVRGDGGDPESVDAVVSMLAGDPVQRAVAARLARREDTPLEALERAFLVPHLLLAMEDGYPAVRRFAAGSLAALDGELTAAGLDARLSGPLAAFDFMAPEADRRRGLDELWRRWRAAPRAGLPPPPAGALLDARLQPLPAATDGLRRLGQSRSKQIHIGE